MVLKPTAVFVTFIFACLVLVLSAFVTFSRYMLSVFACAFILRFVCSGAWLLIVVDAALISSFLLLGKNFLAREGYWILYLLKFRRRTGTSLVWMWPWLELAFINLFGKLGTEQYIELGNCLEVVRDIFIYSYVKWSFSLEYDKQKRTGSSKSSDCKIVWAW